MANRAYKFRIYPNDEQKILFAKTFGCVRMVYNHWLDRKIRQYEENKTNVTYTICAKEMAAMKKMEEYGFLKEADSIALQQALRHLDTAFQNFFKQPKTGFPRFKSKKRNKNSYSTVCINGNITISNGYLKLPKIGQVRLKQHRFVPSEYRLKSVTVSQTPSGKYYASILFEYEDQVQEKELQKFLGLDFSMHELYRDSNGKEPAYPGYYRNAEKKEIAVSVDCPEDLTVSHDSKWTSEALFNLLDNAVKYTPAGGKIAVSVVLWEMYVEVKVTDTGKGISESNQAAIFRRFYREEEVHEQQGVGIGLYLAREIVTRQGGYIKVVSEPGKGSEFSIMLPTK